MELKKNRGRPFVSPDRKVGLCAGCGAAQVNPRKRHGSVADWNVPSKRPVERA